MNSFEVNNYDWLRGGTLVMRPSAGDYIYTHSSQAINFSFVFVVSLQLTPNLCIGS